MRKEDPAPAESGTDSEKQNLNFPNKNKKLHSDQDQEKSTIQRIPSKFTNPSSLQKRRDTEKNILKDKFEKEKLLEKVHVPVVLEPV